MMSVFLRLTLLSIFLFAPVVNLRAQDDTNTDTQQDRIVDGRPPLYTIKRDAHPLTWLELAFKPGFQLGEGGWVRGLTMRKPDPAKKSGVAFGLAGNGTSSGFGPKVTFFNKDFLHRGIDIEVPLVYTYSRYQLYQFQASIPLAAQPLAQRLTFNIGASYDSRARDDYFGLGNDSSRPDERQVRTVTRGLSAGFSEKLSDDWTARVRAVYRRVGVTKPTTGFSAQDHFDASTTPGLYGAAIGSAVFSIGRDTKAFEDYQFKGGSDQLDLSFNYSPGGKQFEYWRYHFDTQHFLHLTSDGRKVIAFRGLFETNQTPGGHDVPFFDMPFIGSGETLRGFENFRFRDKNAAAVTLEYRYRIWPALDWGFFLDEGQVAPRLQDLAFNRFHTGYGVRLFVWPKSTLPLSIDYGRSHETWRLYFNFNTRF
jgi:outer membrane protein assembly factor BamA